MIDILFRTDGSMIGTGESTEAHQQDLLILHKGWHRFEPQVGVGSSNYLDDEDSTALLNEVQRVFTKDGMELHTLAVDNQTKQIIVDAVYKG